MSNKYVVPPEVIRAIGQALADIREGVVSFDSEEYEPIISEWFDRLDEEDNNLSDDVVYFFTLGSSGAQENIVSYAAGPSGWVNHPMFHSSAYKPAIGERGPWHVIVHGTEVASGIGLPDGLHVSTFLVVEDRIDTPQPQPGKDKYQVLKNGVQVAAWES